MPIVSVQCPHCGRSYSLDGSLVGRKGRCKNCGNWFAITRSGELAGPALASGNSQGSGPAPGLWSSATPLPEKIGRFFVKERLGAGACGTVYRAFDPTLDREVALKVPHPEFQRDEKAISRFLREAKAAARLHHPYIVTVFEAGTDGDTSYIASAVITGRSLAAAIDDGPFEPRRAARIVAALADALYAAHQQGIIHRDVKPANVLLDAADWPHLADFGLARLAVVGAKLTKVGSILGTPAYLAPEQAQGKSDQAEPASDQYSLGATLYELLSGQVPFGGPLEVVLFNTLHTPPPPLRDERPEIPAELEAICLKTLAKKPEERYASCRALAKDLEKWMDGRPNSLEVSALPSGSSTAVAEAGAPGALVSDEEPLGDQTSVPIDPSTTSGSRWQLLAWVQRNRLITGLAASLFVSCIFLNAWLARSPEKTEPFPLKTATGGPNLTDQPTQETTIPTPNHPAVPSAAQSNAEKAPASDKATTLLAANNKGSAATDRPKPVAKSPEKSLASAPASTKKDQAKPDPVLALPYENRIQAAYQACLANQGDRARVILASCPAELRGWEWYYCQRLSRGGMTKIPGQDGAIRTFEFSPDGRLIAFSGQSSVRIWDGKQQKKLGDQKDVVGLAFTDDGKRAISLGADNMVREWEVASGTSLRSFELPLPALSCNAISQGARWVAAGNHSGIIRVWDLNTQAEADSRNLSQPIRTLAFNADATKIIAGLRDGVSVVDWQNVKSKPAIRKLGSSSRTAVSPDGRSLAALARGNVQFWDLAANAKTGSLDQTEGDVGSIVYSQGGTRIATAGQYSTVQVWDATTGRVEGLYQGHTTEVTCLRFSPDDRFIAASSRDGTLRVWKVREEHSERHLNLRLRATSVQVELGGGGGIAFPPISFSDDGKRISFLQERSTLRKKAVTLIDSGSLAVIASYDDLIGLSLSHDKIAQVNVGRIIIKDPKDNRALGEFNFDPEWWNSPHTYASELILLENNTHLFRTKTSEHTIVGVCDNTKGDVLWSWSNSGDVWKIDTFDSVTLLPRSDTLVLVQTTTEPFLFRHVVKTVDVRSGETLEQFPSHCYAVQRNGDLLAIIEKQKVEVRSLKEKKWIAAFNGEMRSFDPTGRLVAIRNKGTTAVCELSTGRRMFEFKAQSAVEFSPDGRRIVATQSNDVMVIDSLTGKVLLTLDGKGDSLVFSPDGRIIAATTGTTARIWVADPTPAATSDGS